jgi:hypothetical protein
MPQLEGSCVGHNGKNSGNDRSTMRERLKRGMLHDNHQQEHQRERYGA